MKKEQEQSILSNALLTLQVAFCAFFISSSTYDTTQDVFHFNQYIVFRDIMAMLLLGFGYLMTFLKSYGLGAVGFTMLLTVLAMQLNVGMEYGMRAALARATSSSNSNSNTAALEWPLHVTMMNLIDAEFAAATLLISFGALIGRASPLQMIVLTCSQAFFYAMNKVLLVFGYLHAEDVGGTITIHMFGAYFGLAASLALGPPPSLAAAQEDKVSDIFALVGTGILWVYWPSFVGATETSHDVYAQRCLSNTVWSLAASTAATFYMSHRLSRRRKFDPVHIANATLAGGVAMGASARLVTSPGAAIALGALAGALSVIGYVYVSPFLLKRFGIADTCGVGNLHGLPSILGAMASLLFIALNPSADFLTYAKGPQMGRQMAAVVTTLAVSIVSGFGTGKVMALLEQDDIQDGTNLFVDKSYWETAYFDPSVRPAASGSTNRMISPNSKHSVKAMSKHSHKYDLAASNRAEAAVAPAPEQQQHALRVDLDEDVSENV